MMNCIPRQLFLLSIAFCCSADPHLASSANTDATSGKIYEVLADYVTAVQEFHRKPSAFVGTGVRTSLKPTTGATEQRLFWIGANKGREEFRASSAENLAVLRFPGEAWTQRIKQNGKSFFRYGSGWDVLITNQTDDEEMLKEAGKLSEDFPSIYPYELGLIPPGVIRSGFGTERGRFPELLLGYDLVSAKFDESGDIRGEFAKVNSYRPEWTMHVNVVFNKTSNWMPTNCEFTSRSGQKVTFGGKTDVIWKLEGDVWVPKTIRIHQHVGFELLHDIEFEWALEKKVADDLIDKQLDDWREPIRLLFSKDWARPENRPSLDLFRALQMPPSIQDGTPE